MLNTVFFQIEKNRSKRSNEIFWTMVKNGIPCERWTKGRSLPDARESVLFLTDEKPLARWAAANQVACIGAAAQEDGFFEGADLVVEQPELLTRQEIEEYLAHYHGIPVVIARTEHLLLREICPADFERLNAISRQAGMETARAETNGESGFEADRLEAYIVRQYRMYGYGLWSVLLPDEREGAERVIGCCGFSECSSEVLLCERNVRRRGDGKGGEYAAVGNAAGNRAGKNDAAICNAAGNCADENSAAVGNAAGNHAGEHDAAILEDEVHPQAVLELQYMLDEAQRRKGYGTEMCRAALDYGYQWLEAEAVWVRVKKENTVGVKFAQSLGFRICQAEEGSSELWMRHERECRAVREDSEVPLRKRPGAEESGDCGCHDLEENNAV